MCDSTRCPAVDREAQESRAWETCFFSRARCSIVFVRMRRGLRRILESMPLLQVVGCRPPCTYWLLVVPMAVQSSANGTHKISGRLVQP